MVHRSLSLAVASVLVAAMVAAPPAHAQGNGRPKAPKSKTGGPATTTPEPTTSTPTPTPSATPTPTADPAPSPTAGAPPAVTLDTSATLTTAVSLTSVFSFRQFGSWLDDASAPTRGEGSTSISVGHWRMADVSQTNLPMLGGAFGVTDRLQVNASVPFYRVSYQGATSSGMDDVYVGAKYTLVDPTLTISEFGLAISPVMEVLSAGAVDGRIHFAVPVTMEIRRAPFRAYGSAGYFTRGSVFTGAAMEWATPARWVVTGALTQSYSVKPDATLDSLAVGRQRVDVTTSAAYPLGNMAAAFMSIGRSLSSPDGAGTKLALTGGLSVRFAGTRSTP